MRIAKIGGFVSNAWSQLRIRQGRIVLVLEIKGVVVHSGILLAAMVPSPRNLTVPTIAAVQGNGASGYAGIHWQRSGQCQRAMRHKFG